MSFKGALEHCIAHHYVGSYLLNENNLENYRQTMGEDRAFRVIRDRHRICHLAQMSMLVPHTHGVFKEGEIE